MQLFVRHSLWLRRITFPATYAAPPGVICSFRFAPGADQHIYDDRPASLCNPSSANPTSRCFELPPKPPATGGCTPRSVTRKKLRCPFAPRTLRSRPSQILPCLRGRVAVSRHGSPSAAFAFRSPASLGGGADVFSAALQTQHRLIPPACPASSTQIRLKRFYYSGSPLIRTAHGFPVADSLQTISRPGGLPSGGLTACPAGLWMFSLVSGAESRNGSFLTRPLLPCSHRHRSRWSRWRWQSRKPA